ncbi:MAG: hypothetical protein RL885_06310 [Planctomycetota bacterium]
MARRKNRGRESTAPSLALEKAGLLTALSDPRELWRTLLWETLDELEAERGCLLISDDRQRLRLRAVCDLPIDDVQRSPALFEHVRRAKGATILTGSPLDRERSRGSHLPSDDALSGAFLPIFGSLGLLGLIYVERTKPMPFDAETIQTLCAKLDSLAPSLERLQLSAEPPARVPQATRADLETLRRLFDVATRASSWRNTLSGAARLLAEHGGALAARLTVWRAGEPSGKVAEWIQAGRFARFWREVAPLADSYAEVTRGHRVALGPEGTRITAVCFQAELDDAAPWTARLELANGEEIPVERTIALQALGAQWLQRCRLRLEREQEHRELEELEAVARGAGWLVITEDRARGRCQASDAVVECTGYTREALEREGWTRLLFPDVSRRQAIDSKLDRRISKPFVAPLTTSDDRLVPMRWRAVTQRGSARVTILGEPLSAEWGRLQTVLADRGKLQRPDEMGGAPRTPVPLAELIEEVSLEVATMVEPPMSSVDSDLMVLADPERLRHELLSVLLPWIGRCSKELAHLECETAPGQDAVTLRLHVPAELTPPEGDDSTFDWSRRLPIAKAPPARPLPEPPLDRERWILIAEPEPIVAGFLRELLESEGHTVRLLSDLGDAGDLCRRYGGPGLALLETASGADVVEHLITRLGPSCPVLLLSTDPLDAFAEQLRDRATSFLAKPFKNAELLERVRAAMGSRASG